MEGSWRREGRGGGRAKDERLPQPITLPIDFFLHRRRKNGRPSRLRFRTINFFRERDCECV